MMTDRSGRSARLLRTRSGLWKRAATEVKIGRDTGVIRCFTHRTVRLDHEDGAGLNEANATLRPSGPLEYELAGAPRAALARHGVAEPLLPGLYLLIDGDVLAKAFADSSVIARYFARPTWRYDQVVPAARLVVA
jgi:hypothetical protein